MNQFEKLKDQVAKAQTAIFGNLNEIIASAEEDAQKYYEKGVNSAGNRLKKKMQEIRKAVKHPEIKATMKAVQDSARDLRGDIIEKIKSDNSEKKKVKA